MISKTREEDYRVGVGILINNDFHFHVRDDLSAMVPHIYESTFIEVTHFNGHLLNNNYIVGVIYRSNTPLRADFGVFSNTLLETMNIINTENNKKKL